MKFIRYENVDDFFSDVEVAISKHEIQNNLIYLNINGARMRKSASNMVMTAVKDDNGKIIITGIRTIPFPYIIYETDNIRYDEAVDFMVRSLIEHGIEIDCAMGEKELASVFAGKYASLTDKKYENTENLVLYLLDKVDSISLPEGRFRMAEEKDMYFLPYWYADFIPACNLGSYDLDEGIKNAKQEITAQKGYIWEDEVPVSYASVSRNTSDCAIISHVYTPPIFRGKGYSSACVSRLSQKLLDDGWKFCALYADCLNPYSNKVYVKVGYKKIFYYDKYRIY